MQLSWCNAMQCNGGLPTSRDIDILLTACSMSCNTYQLQNQMKSRRCNHNMSCICNCVLCMVIRALVQFVCKYCSSHQLMMMHVVYMVMVIGDVYSAHVCTPVHHLAKSNCNLMYYRVYCPSQFHIVTFSSDPSHFPETLQLLVHRLMLTTAMRATIFNTDCNICINAQCALRIHLYCNNICIQLFNVDCGPVTSRSPGNAMDRCKICDGVELR